MTKHIPGCWWVKVSHILGPLPPSFHAPSTCSHKNIIIRFNHLLNFDPYWYGFYNINMGYFLWSFSRKLIYHLLLFLIYKNMVYCKIKFARVYMQRIFLLYSQNCGYRGIPANALKLEGGIRGNRGFRG